MLKPITKGAEKLKAPVHWLLFALPLTFLLLFYFYPLINIGLLSFWQGSHFQLDKITRLFTTDIYLGILWFTTWQAALSTILTLLLALPGAYVFARYQFKGKNLCQALMGIPFVLPTVVTAAAFRALLGSHGILNEWLTQIFNLTQPPIRIEQSITFFLIAHIFYNYTLVLRIVGGFWAGLDPSQRAAAQMLGCSPWQTFRKITLPQLLPAIGSAGVLIFIFCFTSFGIILILGGPQYSTLEVEIYRQSVQFFNLPMAAALSLVQIIVNFCLMWLHARLGRNRILSFYTGSPTTSTVRAKRPAEKFIIGCNLGFMTTLLLTPLLALVIRSVTGHDGLTITYYQALFTSGSQSVFFVPPFAAVQNSVFFAFAAMLLAVVLGLLAVHFLAREETQHTALWDAVIMLPLATSAVTLGFGYIITLNKPPLNLRDSFLLVPIAHALVAFPFVVRCILPSLKSIPKSLREVAALLGCSPFAVWRRVDLPLISRAIIVAAVFAFSISMGEFGASAFVTRPHTPTMPVAIFRFLSQPGEMNYGQAMAMSTILMLVSCSGFWLLGKLDHPGRPLRN